MASTSVPRTISISEFKAHCLRLVEDVSSTGQEILITKRGKPVARVSGLRKQAARTLGQWKGRVEEAQDIVNADGSQAFEATRDEE
jgi:prevent-host-death family protein